MMVSFKKCHIIDEFEAADEGEDCVVVVASKYVCLTALALELYHQLTCMVKLKHYEITNYK
jgi:hypothetical protein